MNLDSEESLLRQGETVVRIPVDSIHPGSFQPRKRFIEEDLTELAVSIQAHGVIQPVVVRPGVRGYELVVGERRWRAAQMAGLREIPAVVRPMSDRDAALVALVENVQRENLHFIEEAESYQRLLVEFGLTQEELARRLGKSQPSVANKLRLLRLPEDIKQIISREMLSERHARALLKLPHAEKQREVLQEVVLKGLTVNETEKLVERILGGRGRKGSSPRKNGRSQRLVGVFRDLRIFMNAFEQSVRTLQSAGVDAQLVKEDCDDYLEVRVRIPKSQVRGWRASGAS